LEPVAVAFANEEGARFGYPFWGSNAFVGRADRLPGAATGADGGALAEALRLVGGDINALDEAAWPPGLISAYLELHIEQGPVLERLGLPIGVVESIVGRTLVELEIVGTADHAGTSPMEGRRDALVVASELVLAVRAIAAERKVCRVATAGVLTVHPGNANVIPGLASLTAEVRDTVPSRLALAEQELLSQVERLSARTGCAIGVRSITRIKPVPTDPRLIDLIATTAGDIGYGHMTMPSGAGHDAQIVAEAAPVGMIFVPSRAGRSHVPEEFTEPADLVAGARVLAACAANLCATAGVPAMENLDSGSIR
jgi:N-carbamoyl-L-amino-acid hydrolase